ncbi:AmmeMemoRadiSam system protein B [Dehalogenimonas etheniformans]|uniref:MEMO1 family protein JP09_001805 n=1 Tax=Dehalogenimonas etheniformans TaxID=1536648 RepID=A0A2P5P9S2_9CHLR|nr:AmmeMemoRadiSam system protein B [Dehalogenimonas etheniformans]PPD59058.1 AmmeMemoRadiSam system protein B [Dehalogenimonas etheniformans]QNT76594.1 AmmeMemoRadiSam system protein B [Dehalogenimonas etheniformans]
MTRQPIASGRFYPGNAEQIKALIDSFTQGNEDKVDAIGVVAPHAGYIYSGSVATAVFSRVEPADTYIIIGPNHTGMGKPFSIMTVGSWKTPLGEVPIDSTLAQSILAKSKNLQEDRTAHQNEHSIEVQLPIIQYFKPDLKIVPIILSVATLEIYHEIGAAIAQAIKETDGKSILIVASSDMTHYESQEAASAKDHRAIEEILKLDEEGLLNRVVKERISMCGYASVVTMLTAAKILGAKTAELVRYQTSGDASGDYSAVVGYAGVIVRRYEMSPLVKLAKETVEAYVKERRIPKPPVELTPEMKEQAGVFVSIKKDGQLRGCIGTFEPTRANVAEEIIANAVSAATRDPRFLPITPQELDRLSISVDVLTKPEPAEFNELDPRKYGVIAECGYRRGLLLPDLEGVDTAKDQVSICCQKAGISPNEPIKLSKFQVKRYH